MQKSVIVLIFLTISIVSCKAKKEYSYSEIYPQQEEAKFLFDKNSDSRDMRKLESRKIIFNATISIVTSRPDSASEKLFAIAKKFEGYVQQSNSNYTIIRVKSSFLNEAMTSIAKLGKVQYKSIESEDVTENYKDLEIRLDNSEKTRKRYLELLEKAQNVGEIILIEKELERLNQEIDLLKGKIKNYDHLTEFSTISVTIKEKVKPGIFGYLGLGLYHAVKWLFVRN